VRRALTDSRKAHKERGDYELVTRMIDLELGWETDALRKADLYLEKGRVLADELLNEKDALRCFERVLELRPGDEAAEDAMGHIALVRDNWQKIVKKYLEEAKESTDRQLTTNAERGGALYALNCRACHGLVGKGALESSVLPGLPLNSDLPYRDQGAALAGNQQRYRDTIRCGRVGTVMPSWHQDYGGPLNDFQIQQLVTLITSTASAEATAYRKKLRGNYLFARDLSVLPRA
jgi:mono/diheme cytochrome c family protein